MSLASDADLDILVGKLDLETKVRLLSGAGAWTLEAIPEIGLRTLTVSDGPVGVRGGTDTELEPSAALPSGSGMAATWDEELLRRIGPAARRRGGAQGRRRRPRADDQPAPVAAGRPALRVLLRGPAAVRATGHRLRPRRAGAGHRRVPQALRRQRRRDRPLHRRQPGRRADAARAVPGARSRPSSPTPTRGWSWPPTTAVNGTPMTENDLLAEPLKGEWGFDGVVVSDWGATYNGEPAARAALDLTMPGPHAEWREPLVEAVRDGRVPEAAIDEKVRRILRLAARAGALDGVAAGGEKPAAGRIADAAPLAREAAAAAAVLLRNDGLLPLPGRRPCAGSPCSGPAPRTPARWAAGRRACRCRTWSRRSPASATALDGRAEVVTAVGATLSDSLRRRAGRRARPDPGEGSPSCSAGWTPTVRRSPSRPPAPRRSSGCSTPSPTVPSTLEVHTGFVPDEDGEWRLGVIGLRPVRARGGRRRRAGRDRGAGGLRHPPDVRLAAAALDDGPAGRRAAGRRPHPVPLARRRGSSSASGWSSGRPRGRPTRSSRTPSSWPAPATSRSSSSAPARTWRARASTGRRWRCPAGRTSSSAPSPRSTRARSSSSTPARPSSCRGATRCPPSWCPGSRAWSSATRWPTSCSATSSPAAGCPPPGRPPWPTRRCARSRPTDGRLDYTEGLDIGHRAYVAAGTEPAFWFGHGLGYTTWEYESIEAAAVRRRADRAGAGAQHRRPARQAGRAGLRVAAGLGRRATGPLAGRLHGGHRRAGGDRRGPGRGLRPRAAALGDRARLGRRARPGDAVGRQQRRLASSPPTTVDV